MLAVLLGTSAVAQTEVDLFRSKLNRFHKRDASLLYQQRQFPMGKVVAATPSKDAQGLQLPENNWFPGEWEEVRAVVVTCYYEYLVPGHESSIYWMADPLVSGYAQYYQYSLSLQDWTEQGSGPYTAVIDTTSTFGNVFFYLMDAIQMGGAEAWVRVEAAEDSNIVLRKLDRMGLRHENVRFIVGTGNSFWYRDCGPIAFYYGDQDSVGMVDFGYYPGRALDDSLPHLIEQQMGIPNFITTIEWEGGNCLVDGAGMVISSDAIYSGNLDDVGQLTWDGVNPNTINYSTKPRLTRQNVKDSLAHILGPRATYILPAFRYDGGTGHIDLYADMWDENEFVFSKFPEAYSRWIDYTTASKNIDSLLSYDSYFDAPYKCHYIPFPCTDNGGTFASQVAYNRSYTRTYSNHTFVNNVLVQPCFSAVVNGEPSAQWDKERIDSVRAAYPGYTVYPINVKEFDGSGGAIHCITKQIPADNPIRILHHSITRQDGEQTCIARAIEATLTNRSGIASAVCMWRVDGGEWHSETMGTGGDSDIWGAVMDFSQAGLSNGQEAVVEYYISATSNNGKTITKPMTAAQGGYYTFDLVYDSSVQGIQPTVEGRFGNFYPNPASDVAYLEVTLGSGMIRDVQVVDVMGRMVAPKVAVEQGRVALFTNTLAKGMYSVVFTTGNGERVVRRLVVK